MERIELFNDHFQNFKVYGIPKAQLIIADPPYNLGKNAYASNPSWYVDGDNRNGESELAGKAYAAAYLLMTVAMDYVDSGDEAVKAAGFHRNDIKQESGRVHKQFDRFCKAFDKYIGQGDSRVILRDYEEIKPKIEEILEVEL